jgi:type II secretory pathway predicted ATPase ExeA
MPGMTAAETTSYITHHIKLARRAGQMFTEDALNLIHLPDRRGPRHSPRGWAAGPGRPVANP